jgi:predicted amidophosphoribosyltransferase
MWLFQGWTGFRKQVEGNGTRVCPNCRRRVEEDLDFCYHCMQRLQVLEKGPPSNERGAKVVGGRRRNLELEGLEGDGGGQRK